jgi:hypothetical protein
MGATTTGTGSAQLPIHLTIAGDGFNPEPASPPPCFAGFINHSLIIQAQNGTMKKVTKLPCSGANRAPAAPEGGLHVVWCGECCNNTQNWYQ